ncbi:MAG: hypothetical protein HOH95_14220 [Dehalococcoidia bacterium]|nr:hypothetical protein [Dehalococcoidia bacterium]
MVDTTEGLTVGRASAISAFEGPRLLVTSVPLSYPQIESLMSEGYDAVLSWPGSALVVAARAARLVSAGRQAQVAAPRTQRRASAYGFAHHKTGSLRRPTAGWRCPAPG